MSGHEHQPHTPETVHQADTARRPERKQPDLRALLWHAVLAAPLEKEYLPDRERQLAVFDRIAWDTFRDEIFEGFESASDSDGNLKTEGAGKMIRGKLFEMFINADPTFGQRTALEKELLSLAHNPDAYGLGKELGYHRNPDMAFLIVEKEDGVVIEGIGESKLGLLNERSFKQLSETGFARGVKALADVVNTVPDPEAHGLKEVARARETLRAGVPLLRVAPEFTQLLVVPANRHIEWTSTLLNRREFTAEGRQKFYELLEDVEHVKVARAAFSTAEVSAVVDQMISKSSSVSPSSRSKKK